MRNRFIFKPPQVLDSVINFYNFYLKVSFLFNSFFSILVTCNSIIQLTLPNAQFKDPLVKSGMVHTCNVKYSGG